MNAGEAFSHHYLLDTLKILESAAKLSLQVVYPEQDEDLANYLVQLRETIVESYTTIVHGVNDKETRAFLVKYSPNIIAYLQQLVQKPLNPSMVSFH